MLGYTLGYTLNKGRYTIGYMLYRHEDPTDAEDCARCHGEGKLDDDEECFECDGCGYVSPSHEYEREDDRPDE